MKLYPNIQGPTKAPKKPCIAFYKHDGSNLRFEWSKKRGWYKYGTRKELFDVSHPLWGKAIEIFQDTYADDLEEIFAKNKEYKKHRDGFTVYCEFFGPSSIGFYHDWDEPKELCLFDINVNKRGFILPRQFVKDFGHLKIPAVIYEGNFSLQFVQDVWNGVYPVQEGVVAKGVLENRKGRLEHSLWLAKEKTKWWFDKIRCMVEKIDQGKHRDEWKQLLEENVGEQELMTKR